MNIQYILALSLFTFSSSIISDTSELEEGYEFKGYAVQKINIGYYCEHSSLPKGTIVEITSIPPEEPEVKEQKIAKPVVGGSGKLESKFGHRNCRRCSKFHKGLDYKGKKVVAALDGVVSKSGWGGSFGRLVILDHKGKNGKVKKTTLYGHMKRCNVKHGQKVKKGDILGDVGSTGRSTGAHLHFEMSKNSQGGLDGHLKGKKVNPLPYIQGKKKVEVAVTEPSKKTTCTIIGPTHYKDEILSVTKTIAKKIGMEKDKKLLEVAVKVIKLPQG
jgi:murein DD-endopeptidase MepM/ murein hydrolase activator NlpD